MTDFALRHKHLTTCHACKDHCKRVDGAAVCDIDSLNILHHADNVGCPKGKYDAQGCLDETVAAEHRATVVPGPSRIIHGIVGAARALTGTGGASPVLVKQRFDVCKQCPQARVRIGIVETCGLCGCVLQLKVRNATERCPIGRWLPQEESPVYGHTGDLGDVVYACSAIKAAGGGSLYLHHDDHIQRNHSMNAARVDLIKPLLLAQPYIRSVEYLQPHEVLGRDRLDNFRSYLTGCNLDEAHFKAIGQPYTYSLDPWLQVDRVEHAAPVLFARSARYRNPEGDVMWKRLAGLYGAQAAFVGIESEYRDFTERFGDVPFYRTDDLLQLARVIAGCKLFCGNQSSPFAIAEGLKVPTILEVCRDLPNCSFPRADAIILQNAADCDLLPIAQ